MIALKREAGDTPLSIGRMQAERDAVVASRDEMTRRLQELLANTKIGGEVSVNITAAWHSSKCRPAAQRRNPYDGQRRAHQCEYGLIWAGVKNSAGSRILMECGGNLSGCPISYDRIGHGCRAPQRGARISRDLPYADDLGRRAREFQVNGYVVGELPAGAGCTH